MEEPSIFLITPPVSSELWSPVFDTSLRNSCINATFVLVPETSADFDNLLEPWEDEIGFARKRWNMEPVSKPH
jgi:hypothetical protein